MRARQKLISFYSGLSKLIDVHFDQKDEDGKHEGSKNYTQEAKKIDANDNPKDGDQGMGVAHSFL